MGKRHQASLQTRCQSLRCAPCCLNVALSALVALSYAKAPAHIDRTATPAHVSPSRAAISPVVSIWDVRLTYRAPARVPFTRRPLESAKPNMTPSGHGDGIAQARRSTRQQPCLISRRALASVHLGVVCPSSLPRTRPHGTDSVLHDCENATRRTARPASTPKRDCATPRACRQSEETRTNIGLYRPGRGAGSHPLHSPMCIGHWVRQPRAGARQPSWDWSRTRARGHSRPPKSPASWSIDRLHSLARSRPCQARFATESETNPASLPHLESGNGPGTPLRARRRSPFSPLTLHLPQHLTARPLCPRRKHLGLVSGYVREPARGDGHASR